MPDGRMGVNNNSTPNCTLDVIGAVNLRGTTPYAIPNGYNNTNGCLTIGDTNTNYGGVSGFPVTGGLCMECLDSTEIFIHDSGHRLVSPMWYQGGGSYNIIHIGRDMGWGTTKVNFPGSYVSWANDWIITSGTAPNGAVNSFIFWHWTSTINSKWCGLMEHRQQQVAKLVMRGLKKKLKIYLNH